jgi:F0F1-type ATP synthase membrane subunit b/b'
MTCAARLFATLCLRLGAFLGWLLVFSIPAFANDEPSASTPEREVFRWVNFAIVFGGAAWLLIRKAGPAFRSHSESIADAIADSRVLREAAEHQRQEAERKLAMLDAEIARMRQSALEDGAAEAHRLRSLAAREIERIQKSAQDEIRAAERASRLELKRVAARLSIARAEALLRVQLTPQADSNLFRSFLAGLNGGAN